MIKAIIFDMDGLMIDSERVTFECYQERLKDMNLTMDELIKTMQVPYKGKLDVFKNKFFTYQDGKNTNRVVDLILEILKKPLY